MNLQTEHKIMLGKNSQKDRQTKNPQIQTCFRLIRKREIYPVRTYLTYLMVDFKKWKIREYEKILNNIYH